MQEAVIEEHHVPGLKRRPDNAKLAGRLLGCLRGHQHGLRRHLVAGGTLEVLGSAALAAGVEKIVDPARHEVEAGSVDPAVGKRNPDVQGPGLPHERAVLVPAPRGTRIGLSQRALLDRHRDRLGEELADHPPQADALE